MREDDRTDSKPEAALRNCSCNIERKKQETKIKPLRCASEKVAGTMEEKNGRPKSKPVALLQRKSRARWEKRTADQSRDPVASSRRKTQAGELANGRGGRPRRRAGKNGCGAGVDIFRPNHGQPKARPETMRLSSWVQPRRAKWPRILDVPEWTSLPWSCRLIAAMTSTNSDRNRVLKSERLRPQPLQTRLVPLKIATLTLFGSFESTVSPYPLFILDKINRQTTSTIATPHCQNLTGLIPRVRW